MSGRLNGKVAIVTGSGRGIGRGIALRFAREGAKVVLANRTAKHADAVADQIAGFGGECLATGCDVADRQQVKEMVARSVERFRQIDILVNCAQSWGPRDNPPPGVPQLPPEELPEEWWDHTFETGVKGTMRCCTAVFPFMKDRGGKMINFGSSDGMLGSATKADYAANKEAIRGLTRSLARAWGRYKINVNVIIPGIETDALATFREKYPERLESILREMPLQRFGDAEQDAGGLAVFLSSSDSDFMTGGTFMLNGGRLMH